MGCVAVFFFLLNRGEVDKTKSVINDLESTVVNFSDKQLNEPEEVVLSFYKKYLSGVYLKDIFVDGVYPKLNPQGIYELDREAYIKFLDDSRYFSQQFYENQKPIFDKCDKMLAQLSTYETGSVESFEELTLPDGSCSFVFSNSWVGGQGENLDAVDILESSVDEINNMAVVKVAIGFKYENGYVPYSYPKVTLLKESDGWKISNVKVNFDDKGLIPTSNY